MSVCVGIVQKGGGENVRAESGRGLYRRRINQYSPPERSRTRPGGDRWQGWPKLGSASAPVEHHCLRRKPKPGGEMRVGRGDDVACIYNGERSEGTREWKKRK